MLDYTLNNSLATQLCQPETLHAAWRKVRANKGAPGSDGVTIQQFEANLAKHLRQLSRELAEERLATERRARHALEHAQKHRARLKLTLNPKKTQIAHFDAGVEFLGHIFDKDGCYQPVPEPRTKVLQNQVQRALKTGAVHVKRSGQHVAQQGKNVATHIGQHLKNRKTRNINC